METICNLYLYINHDYITGIFDTGDGKCIVINENYFYLYFRDEGDNQISYNENYKSNFIKGELGYYGNFFKDTQNFELLDRSGIIDTILYNTRTVNGIDSIITTYIVAADNIKEKVIRKFSDFIKSNGNFDIKPNIVRLSELATYYYERLYPQDKEEQNTNYDTLFVGALNSDIVYGRVAFRNRMGVFFLDSPRAYQNMGIDPTISLLGRKLVSDAAKHLKMFTNDTSGLETQISN